MVITKNVAKNPQQNQPKTAQNQNFHLQKTPPKLLSIVPEKKDDNEPEVKKSAAHYCSRNCRTGRN